MKGKQLGALQRILPSSFWTNRYLCVLGVYRICCATRGATSVGGDLLCSLVLEWRTIAPVLQLNA